MGTSRIGRTIALIGAAASLTLTISAGVAVAGGSGEPVAQNGGSAVVDQRGTTTISDVTKPKPGMASTLATTTKVGGGTWTYGRQAVAFPNDKCFSNYVHNSVYHSATTIFGDGNSKRFADPSLYANSSVTKNGFFTTGCRTYWNTY
ncbi:lactococcin 972 family bacteriocin [Arthrobacter sp. MDT1-48-3]